MLAAAAAAAALAAVQIVHTGFEGARLERVETVAPDHFRCHLRGDVDQDRRNRQANWYYFRLDNAQGRAITIDLTNLPGEYNYQPNRGAVTKDTVPVWSEDNINWRHFDSTEFNAAEPSLRLRVKPSKSRFWIAHVPPYTGVHLAALLAAARRSPHFQAASAGQTVDGREMPLWTITDRSSTPPAAARKRVVWLMFRQHGWETGSSWAGEGVVRFLLSNDPAASRIRREAIVRIFPLADPDGVHRGNVRFNKYGFDLNRNWDLDDPAKMPEIAAQNKAIAAWLTAGNPIDLFLSLHNTETGEYLEGPPGNEPAHAELGRRFFEALKRDSTFAPTRDFFQAAPTTPAGKSGRMTVSQGLYHRHRLPAFIMEQMIARNPRLGHLPTREDRLAFGAQLIRAAFAAVSAPGGILQKN